MTVMRSAPRAPLAAVVPLLLLVAVAGSAGGCSGGADVEGSGPTVTATGPGRSSESPTKASVDEPPGSPSQTSGPSGRSDALAAVCAPYVVMVRAIKNAAFSGGDPDQVAAALAPVMKEFAARLPDVEQPPGMPAAVWRGIEALASQILALPDRPTYAEIEAVESELSEREHDDVDAAAVWFRTTCRV